MKAEVIESMARAGDADVEPIIEAWSKAGILKEAAAGAIQKAHQEGRSVTIIEEGIIYLLLPDGSKKEVRKLSRKRNTNYTSGSVTIGK